MNADQKTGELDSDSAETIREFMDEKVKIESGINPSTEKEIDALLHDLPGVETVTVAGDEVSITYEPTQITSKEIHERMRQAGLKLGEGAIAPSDPPVGR